MAKDKPSSCCRVCNGPPEVSLFDSCNGTNLAELMSDFASVLIEQSDWKPASICMVCEGKLKCSLEFRKVVRQAEERLKLCSENISEAEHPPKKIKLEAQPADDELYEYEFLEEYPDETRENQDLNAISAPEMGTDELLKVLEASDNEDTCADSSIESDMEGEQMVEDEQVKFLFEMPSQERIAQRLAFEGFEYLEIIGDRCCGCSFIAANRDELLLHSKDKHAQNYYADSGYTCPTCYQKFDTKDRLTNHIGYYSFSDVFLCSICKESFVHKSHLKAHQKTSHALQSGGTTAKSGLKRRHTKLPSIRTMEKFLKFVCCFVRCWDSFSNEEELLAHVTQTHDGKRRENDLACSKLHPPSNHICSVCHRPFESESKLHFHRSYKQKRNEHICLECGKSFPKLNLLRDHQQKDHDNQSPQFECDICGKSFLKQSVLKTHRKTHVPFESVPCSEPGCELVFRDTALMKRHCRNVHGESAWLCRFCPKKLRTKEALDIHERVHTGEKPFPCREGCERRFAHATDRVRHERSVHTNEKPHKCNLCNAAYVRRRELVLHLQKNHRSDEN